MYTSLQKVYMRFCELMLPTADLQRILQVPVIIYQSLRLQRWPPRPGMGECRSFGEDIYYQDYHKRIIFANSETSELILVILEKL